MNQLYVEKVTMSCTLILVFLPTSDTLALCNLDQNLLRNSTLSSSTSMKLLRLFVLQIELQLTDNKSNDYIQ